MFEPQVMIPADFWKGLSAEDFGSIMQRGTLDALQCARLWRMTDRNDACPTELQVRFRREDVERCFPKRAP